LKRFIVSYSKLFYCLLALLVGCSDPYQQRDSDSESGPYRADPKDFAVIVNSEDPHSRDVADYYVERRKIPPGNVIQIQFDPSLTVLSAAQFAKIKTAVDQQVPKHVQFFVLSWTQTYGVECASITAAFAFGYSESLSHCERTCEKTKFNPYVEDEISRPYSQLGIRPTMMLAAKNFTDAVRLIDRGQSADFSHPSHHRAFLMETSDETRSVRKKFYPDIQQEFGDIIDIEVRNSDLLSNERNVMFYFTGLPQVPEITSNSYLPGAVADHLTSFGGQLTGRRQMSALAWLQAGVTASYGTVVEPCSHTEKFPDPGRLMRHYFAGATVIEAYWKSVLMPGQGLFIGEPMARPYQTR
jgi:uncharacterized protein (TIGR03790 family)